MRRIETFLLAWWEQQDRMDDGQRRQQSSISSLLGAFFGAAIGWFLAAWLVVEHDLTMERLGPFGAYYGPIFSFSGGCFALLFEWLDRLPPGDPRILRTRLLVIRLGLANAVIAFVLFLGLPISSG